MRFQQVTGPVMAKGVEDTAFYRYNRLVALNEVGGDPGTFGRRRRRASTARWSRPSAAGRRPCWPTSTHDTKRSEDVRARIALLSEIPDELGRRGASGGRRCNERHRSGDLPDRNLEYLLYQTLVGAQPLDVDRAVAYMEKATQEAKAHTSWIDPDPAYDEALRRFVEGVLGDERVPGRPRRLRRAARRAGPASTRWP